nr:MAG TPA: hypothetical protein [Caudoviricetes sp.]
MRGSSKAGEQPCDKRKECRFNSGLSRYFYYFA